MSQQGIVALLNAGRLLQSPSAQKYPVIRVTMHESYDRRTVNNDMALLRLNRPVPLSTTSPVIPVCLPASNAIDFSGFQATVAGCFLLLIKFKYLVFYGIFVIYYRLGSSISR